MPLTRELNAGPDAPADVLYDFLYRDTGRLSSYYAQIFKGRLASLEELDNERDLKAKRGDLNTGVLKGQLESVQEVVWSSKRIIDPHDVVTTDILAYLIENGFISNDILNAPHGSLVLVQGHLTFIDRTMMAMITGLIQELALAEKRNTKNRNKGQLNDMQVGAKIIEKLLLPSVFSLTTTNDIAVAGTLKDEGMEEPIGSYYLKHGGEGLAEIYLIGVKEEPSLAANAPHTLFTNAVRQLTQALNEILFPVGAVMVTPLVLFRKLTPLS